MVSFEAHISLALFSRSKVLKVGP